MVQMQETISSYEKMVVVSCDINCISNILRSCTWFKSTICVFMFTYVLPEKAIILFASQLQGTYYSSL